MGDPAYAKKLDRDNDGVACEKSAASKEQQAKFVMPPKPEDNTSTGTKVETGNGDGVALPQTGPAGEIGIAGGLLLTVGIVAAVINRRRKLRFTA